MKPLLSVVMPTHNVEDWVCDAVGSVLHQEGVALELIVVDDHSTDGTWDLLSAWAASDARLRLMRSPGSGSSAARNYGVEAARGSLLAFADSDDIVGAGSYRALIDSMEVTGAEMVLGNCAQFAGEVDAAVVIGEPLDFAMYSSLGARPELINRVTLWGAVYRRAAWDRLGVVARDAVRGNDLVPKATMLLGARGIDTIGETVYYYRRAGSANVMSRRSVTAAGLQSHFVEHTERARLISELGSSRIREAAAKEYVFVDGFEHIVGFAAAAGRRKNTEISLMEQSARATVEAYQVSLCSVLGSKDGWRNVDKIIAWWASLNVAWPLGLLPARGCFWARRKVKWCLQWAEGGLRK